MLPQREEIVLQPLSSTRRHGLKLLLNIRPRGRLQFDSASGADLFLDLAHHNNFRAHREEMIVDGRCSPL